MRNFHGIFDNFLFLFVKFAVKIVLHVAQSSFKLFVQFVDGIVEKIIAKLFEQMSDLIKTFIYMLRFVKISASDQRKGDLRMLADVLFEFYEVALKNVDPVRNVS